MSKYINLSAIKQFLIGLRNAFDSKVLYNKPMSAWNYGESDNIPTTWSLPVVLTVGGDLPYKRLLIEAISNDGVYVTTTVLTPFSEFNIWDWSVDSSNTAHLKILSCAIGQLPNPLRIAITPHWKSGEKTISAQNTTFTAGYFFTITKVIGYKH